MTEHAAPITGRAAGSRLRTFSRLVVVGAVFFLGVVVGLLMGDSAGTQAESSHEGPAASRPDEDPVPAPGPDTPGPDTLPAWSPGDGSRLSQIAVGGITSCALWNDGRVECWGWGGSFLEGVTATEERFRAITMGDTHACGINAEGTTVCWGASVDGVPLEALDATFLSLRGATPGPGQDIQQCGLREGGVVCWVPDWQGPRVTRTVDGDFVDFAVSSEQHLCTIDASGLMQCSGGLIPHVPPTDVRFASVDLGWFHGCGLSVDGEVHCFGAHPDASSMVDALVEGTPAGSGFIAVSVGELDACALREDLSVECWGFRGFSAPAGLRLRSVHVGVAHACGIDPDGQPLCWGDDQHGQSLVPDR